MKWIDPKMELPQELKGIILVLDLTDDEDYSWEKGFYFQDKFHIGGKPTKYHVAFFAYVELPAKGGEQNV